MELLKNNPGYHTTEYAQLQANRLALRGQSNPLTAHRQAGEMRQLI